MKLENFLRVDFIFLTILTFNFTKYCAAELLEGNDKVFNILIKTIIHSQEEFGELCPPLFVTGSIVVEEEKIFENVDLFWKKHIPVSFLNEKHKFSEMVGNGEYLTETILKHNFPCKTYAIFLSTVPEKDNFLKTVLESGESNPQSDRYIFIGPYEKIHELLHSDITTKKLKLKMGVGIRKNGIFTFSPVYDLPDVYSVAEFRGGNDSIPTFSSQSFNLRGRMLTATWMNLSPYIFNTSETTYMGFCYNALKYSSEKYNISIKFHPTWQKYGGFQYPNGTWVGSVAAVLYGEVDFSAVIAPTEKRYQIIDFSTDLLTDFFIFVTAHPQQTTNWRAIFYPYTVNCWLVIYGCCLAIIPVFYFSLELPPNSHDTKLSRALLITYSVSVEQGVPLEKGIKFILTFWLFFMMIIGTGYKSNLVSFLSFPEIEKVPETFQDLDERKDYTLSYNFNGGAGYAFFNGTTNPIYRRLLKRFILIRNVEECVLSSFLQRKTVCLGWKLFVPAAVARMMTLSQNFEPLHTAKQHSHTLTIAFGFRKKSLYTQSFSRISSILRDTGNVDKWANDVLVEEKAKGRKKLLENKSGEIYRKISDTYKEMSRSGVRPFKIVNFALVFSAYLLACILVTFTFLVELYHGHKMGVAP